MIKRIGFLFVVFTVLTMGLSALASDGADGPVEFSFSVKGEYTDNRDGTEAEEEESFNTYVSPRLDLFVESERTLMDLFYEPSYIYRSDPSDIQNEDEWFHSLGLRSRFMPSPTFTLKLDERFEFTDNPSIEEEGATLRRDSSYSLNRAGAGMNWRFTRRQSIDVSGSHKIKSYEEDDVADENDEESFQGTVKLLHLFSRTLAGILTGSAGTYEYGSVPNVDRDFDMMFAGVGLETTINPQFNAGVQVGWKTLEYSDSELESADAPFVSARLEGEMGPSSRLYAAASFAKRDADVYPFASQEYTDFIGRMEFDISPKAILTLGGAYRMSSYDSDDLPTGALDIEEAAEAADLADAGAIVVDRDVSIGGDDTTIIGMVELKYELTVQTYLKLAQNYEDVDSDVDFSFTRNTTSLALIREF